MEAYRDFKSIQEKIQTALVATTRSTNVIAAEDLSFQKTSNPTVEEELDETTKRLLALTSNLLRSATKSTGVPASKLEDADDIDVHWSSIVDVIDNLLEKADTCLDEYNGAVKRRTAPVDNPVQIPPAKKPRTRLDASVRRANILKPQNNFEVKPDNLDTSLPWKPFLTIKPHAVVPLEKSLGTFNDENQTTQYKHPYETEILQLEYPESVFRASDPVKYQPVDATAATFVDTFEGVLDMLQELKEAEEIAIDTEHHDFRTYTGLCSLMQISTREKDWIVDTLQPWRHKLEVLNEVFANPNIVKVLHGAYMDIIWLQRDFGIYIVGMFDTYEAAVALDYPGRSLAYLLKKFVDFDADKKYQMADWRIRPLPDEMFYYARADTHYLLYIYDMMRNELLDRSSPDSEQNLVRQVLDRSKETSMRRHEKLRYDAQGGQGPAGWFNALIKNSSGRLTKEQFAVFRALHKWRDETARREDESPQFILGQPALFDISRRMPPDPKALHSLIDPSSHIARRHITELFKLVTRAASEGANGPTVAEFLRQNQPATMGVGEVAQAVFPNLKDAPAVSLDIENLVSQTSRLWGHVALSGLWEEQSKSGGEKDLHFELPWAHFVGSAQVMQETAEPIEKIESPNPNHLSPTTQSTSNKDEAQIFTLKRKARDPDGDSDFDAALASASDEDEAEAGTTANSLRATTHKGAEEIAVPDSDDSDEVRSARKARRAEKRAKKRAQIQAQKQALDRRRKQKQAETPGGKSAEKAGAAEKDGEDDDDENDEEPFDYSKAKSVLNANRPASGTNGTGSQKKRFNPYGMKNDGPKPARRMHGMKPGKSATFKR